MLRGVLLGPASFSRLCRARELLCESETASPTIAEVAGQVGMSTFHFIRTFEAVFGETPHQLRIRTRIARAKDLLVRGMPVTQVCLDVGFASLGSFSSSFTRRVGASPIAYRQQAQRFVQVKFASQELHVPGCFGLIAQLPASAFRNFGEA